jgi:hypothetical protein
MDLTTSLIRSLHYIFLIVHIVALVDLFRHSKLGSSHQKALDPESQRFYYWMVGSGTTLHLLEDLFKAEESDLVSKLVYEPWKHSDSVLRRKFMLQPIAGLASFKRFTSGICQADARLRSELKLNEPFSVDPTLKCAIYFLEQSLLGGWPVVEQRWWHKISPNHLRSYIPDPEQLNRHIKTRSSLLLRILFNLRIDYWLDFFNALHVAEKFIQTAKLFSEEIDLRNGPEQCHQFLHDIEAMCEGMYPQFFDLQHEIVPKAVEASWAFFKTEIEIACWRKEYGFKMTADEALGYLLLRNAYQQLKSYDWHQEEHENTLQMLEAKAGFNPQCVLEDVKSPGLVNPACKTIKN